MTDRGYRSPFTAWYDEATVRTRPRRMLEGDPTQRLVFFSPAAVPIANHPRIVERGLREIVLAHHAWAYLRFTVSLEHDLVNQCVRDISRGAYGRLVPNEMMCDAFKIYCDEAYHALFSKDIETQIASHFGTAGARYFDSTRRPALLGRFEALLDEVPSAKIRGFLTTYCVIVSETLITSTLVDVPDDDCVFPAIRNLIADHAFDEARHHQFFSQLHSFLWPQLSEEARNAIVPFLPRFIEAFLHPDVGQLGQLLERAGYSDVEVTAILRESFSEERVRRETLHAARATLGLFRQTGVMDSEVAKEVFGVRGWWL